MAVQTLTLAGKRYVLIPEREYQRLSKTPKGVSSEDQRDAAILRRRVSDMKRRGEKPVPYASVRRELGLA